MTADRSRSGGQLRAVMIVAVAVLLGWQITTRQLSRAALELDLTSTATILAPHASSTLTAVAEGELEGGRSAQAIDFAKAALQRSTLAATALRSLIYAYHLRGNDRQASQLTDVARILGWREEQLQAAIVAKDVEAGNMRDAADRLDSLARLVEQPQAVFPIIDNLMTSREFRLEIAGRLARQPLWRRTYLTQLSDVGEAAVRARLLLALALTRGGEEQVRTEVSPFANWLFNKGYVEEAYTLWRRRIAEEPLLNSGPLFDPNFRSVGSAVAKTPFDWNLRPLAGAAAMADQNQGRRGLSAQTDGTVDGDLLEQNLRLAPAAHSFSIKMEPSSPELRDVFRWRVLCGPQRYSLSDDYIRGGGGHARQLFVNFTVPAAGCTYEVLALSLARAPVPEDASVFFSNAILK